jgi:hypothetical protein
MGNMMMMMMMMMMMRQLQHIQLPQSVRQHQ